MSFAHSCSYKGRHRQRRRRRRQRRIRHGPPSRAEVLLLERRGVGLQVQECRFQSSSSLACVAFATATVAVARCCCCSCWRSLVAPCPGRCDLGRGDDVVDGVARGRDGGGGGGGGDGTSGSSSSSSSSRDVAVARAGGGVQPAAVQALHGGALGPAVARLLVEAAALAVHALDDELRHGWALVAFVAHPLAGAQTRALFLHEGAAVLAVEQRAREAAVRRAPRRVAVAQAVHVAPPAAVEAVLLLGHALGARRPAPRCRAVASARVRVEGAAVQACR